jgi:arylsulfatase A-like enzyme
MGAAAQFGATTAFGVWLGDLALLAAFHGQAKTRQWLSAAGAALFVSFSTALVLGSVLGPVLVWLDRHAPDSMKWRAMFRNDEGRARRILTTELAAFFLFGTCSWLAYRAIVVIELSVNRPDTTTLALTGFSWVFCAIVILVWPWCRSAARALFDFAATKSGLRWPLGRIWPLNTLFALGAAIGAAKLMAGCKWDLSAVPWHYLIAACGLIPAVTCAAYAPRATGRFTKRLRRVLGVLMVIAFAASAGAAFGLRPEKSVVRTLAFDRTLSGRVGYAAWSAVFDFDRDGQLGILGGGDCAPLDPHRYLGAVEIIGNGVDEDCDGVDLTPQSFEPRPRMAVGQAMLPRRPTVVLVTIDALSAPKLAALGNTKSLMPHLDELAAQSMVFTRCFAQGPSTRLSFPSMFSSRWDSQLAWERGPTVPHSFAASERQLQDVLDDAGYETVAVIPRDYFDRARWPSITRGFQRVERSALPFGPHNAPQVTDAALRVLTEERNRPLYLWVHYYDAHGPYTRVPGVEYAAEDNEALSLHNTELRYVDRELGRLIEAVAHRPDATYVFVTADHATVFHPNPSSRLGHYGFDLYSATLHVPLIIHGPGIPSGQTVGVVSTMDIAPTIADLIGVNEASFEGTSLMPELLSSRVDNDRVIFHEFYLPERSFHGYEPLEIVSLHTGQWNFILNRARGTYELYDFSRDYFEQHDLYEEQARSPEVMHLKSLLGAFMQAFASNANPLGSNKRNPDPKFQILEPQ